MFERVCLHHGSRFGLVVARHGEVVLIKRGQSVLLSTDSSGAWIDLSIASGFARVCASELTLALIGPGEHQLARIPLGCVGCLEAITDLVVVWEDPTDSIWPEGDLIGDWMVTLLRLRSARQAEQRLVQLFQLLLAAFGLRVAQGYLLPFALPHERVAELIGSTRSTATRSLMTMRQRGDYREMPDEQGLLFTARFLDVI